jgi:hypothetical protein
MLTIVLTANNNNIIINAFFVSNALFGNTKKD